MSFTYMKRLDRLLAYFSGKNYLSIVNIHQIYFMTEMKELEKKDHYNGQGGGKPPDFDQRE